jgi:hypothetical protein
MFKQHGVLQQTDYIDLKTSHRVKTLNNSVCDACSPVGITGNPAGSEILRRFNKTRDVMYFWLYDIFENVNKSSLARIETSRTWIGHARSDSSPKSLKMPDHPIYKILSITNSVWISPNYLAWFHPNPWSTNRVTSNSLKTSQTGNFFDRALGTANGCKCQNF